MSFFPVQLILRDRLVVLIGARALGWERVEEFLKCGARVRVVEPRPMPGLDKLKGEVEWRRRRYRRGDLHGAFLAVAATRETETNKKIRAEAVTEKVLLNVVDRVPLCDFAMMARIRRGDFLIAVATGGQAPALASRVREELEKLFGWEYAALTELLGKIRAQADRSQLKVSMHRLLGHPLTSWLKRGRVDRIRKKVEEIFSLSLSRDELASLKKWRKPS